MRNLLPTIVSYRYGAQSRAQRGAALTELALVLPFLLFTVFGIVEIGRWLNSHLMASRIAFEAVRYAASYPGLDDNQSTMSSSDANCTSILAGHCAVLTRVKWILNRYNAGSIRDIPSANISLEKRSTENVGVNNWVSVSIAIPYRPVFAWFMSHSQVTSAARAAYLFPTSFVPTMATPPVESPILPPATP